MVRLQAEYFVKISPLGGGIVITVSLGKAREVLAALSEDERRWLQSCVEVFLEPSQLELMPEVVAEIAATELESIPA